MPQSEAQHLIALLSTENPHGANEHIDELRQMVHSANRFLNTARLSISDTRLRNHFELYRHISEAVPIYLRFLKHGLPEVRLSAVKLLMQLMDRSQEARPALVELLKVETYPVIIATALEALGRMIARISQSGHNSTRKEDVSLITGFLAQRHDRLVRVAAAGAWIASARADFYEGRSDLPKTVLPLLLEAVQAPIDIPAYAEFPLLDDDLKFISDYVLYARITWTGVDRATKALHELEVPLQTHYLAREMLDRVFERHTTVLPAPEEPPYWRWQHFGGWINYAHSPNAIRYRKVIPAEWHTQFAAHPDDREYRPGRRLNAWQQKVVRAIVDCEPFWTIRTNLFSYFYGLPDDREALRDLAENLNV